MPHSRGISNPRYSGYSFLLDKISLTGLSPCFAQLSRRFSYQMQYLIRVHNTTSPNTRVSGFSLTFASFTRRYIKASQLISFPAPTWMFPSGAFPLLTEPCNLLVCMRSSYSAIEGSMLACNYPALFAASHGLHRRSSLSIPQMAFAYRTYYGDLDFT